MGITIGHDVKGLLILSRRADQSIRIGPDILVTVERIQAGKVSLSIRAPRELAVNREEVAKRIDLENQQPGKQ